MAATSSSGASPHGAKHLTPSDLLRLRLIALQGGSPRADGRWVVYWMQQQRRLGWHHGLQHAAVRAREAGRPLLIVEDLLCDKPWATARTTAFLARGMQEHARALASGPVAWLPLLARTRQDLETGLAGLLDHAVELVTDHIPGFLVPELSAMAARLCAARGLRATAVDAAGFLPLRLLDAPRPTAAAFRHHLHRHARSALASLPRAQPWRNQDLAAIDRAALGKLLPTVITDSQAWLARHAADEAAAIAELPVDHAVPPVAGRGGAKAGARELQRFLDQRLDRYHQRNQPEAEAASGLSPYLHSGQISTAEILHAVLARHDALDPAALPERGGAREGFWPLPDDAQGFLDELLTWREVSWHSAELMPDFRNYRSLPGWAKASLAAHAGDPRPQLYTRAELEAAATHDPVWNAAQREMRQTGVMHNYLRMLWGKKVLEWSPSPEAAWETLIELNNRWCLDGRDPNSWAGIAWCFGRYDRPWFERPIFGVIRYMSSDSARKKLDLSGYLERFGS